MALELKMFYPWEYYTSRRQPYAISAPFRISFTVVAKYNFTLIWLVAVEM